MTALDIFKKNLKQAVRLSVDSHHALTFRQSFTLDGATTTTNKDFQVSMLSSSTHNAANNKNIHSAPPRQPLRRISLEMEGLQLFHHHKLSINSGTPTCNQQRRDSLEKRGSIEIHPSATRRRSSGDSMANYSYQDLIAAINGVQRFVEHHDSLGHIDFEYFDCSDTESDDDEEESDLNDCHSCGSVSSLDETEAAEEELDYEGDVCCTDTDAASLEEVTASSSADDTVCNGAGAATIPHSKRVHFATYAQVREYSITMQATVDNACYLCFSWECTRPDQRVPVRNVPSKGIRRLTLQQRERRLAHTTGLTLDAVYQMEEDLLRQQIEEVRARSEIDSVLAEPQLRNRIT